MKEELLEEIEDSMLRWDRGSLGLQVEQLLAEIDQEDAIKELAMRLYKRYTTYKAESTAALMATIIAVESELAFIKFPENYLFRIAVLRGSMELYECYMEEAIESFLEGKSEDEVFECYSGLYSTAEKLTDAFFPKFTRCIKGMDFNGAFQADPEGNNNLLCINKEDYELMDEVVEKYNTIVGRRDILAALSERLESV